MLGIILGIILAIIIILFCIALCVVSNECEKWEEQYKTEQEKKGKRK